MSERSSGAHGRFVVIDGVDGCGKSTQAGLLAHALRERTGRTVVHLREPGSTAVGERLRALLLSRELDPSPAVEALLFCAARRAMLDDLVAPALARGEHVVCERFHPSTFAYQSVAGGVPEGLVLDLLRHWAGSPEPDLVLLLDLDPEVALARRAGAGDRIEAKGLAFQRRVAGGYRRYAELVPGVVRVDAAREPAAVHASVVAEVVRAL